MKPDLFPVPSSWHFGLGINTQSVSDSIDVIEVGNHLNGVQDVAIRESVFPQSFYIPAADGGRRPRHPHGEPAQRLLPGGKLGQPVIMLDVLGQLLVPCFPTEILPVGFDSIKAVVGPGDHRGQHFAFGTRKA